ncbi:MAG: beta-N-acetylhexosaminidase [Elusimicrobiota bacterium]|jgi:beta-N-acetylhexosaminidase
MKNSLTPLMIGLEGPRADKTAVRRIQETGAVSILLLARNIESPAQTRRLTAELQDKVGRPLLFAVDHEGGWVLRFSSGLTAFPGNAALGKAGDPKLARKVGERMASELSALGIGLNLAPVLDVLGESYNPGIHIRSFGKTPELASEMGCAFIRGMQAGGVAACAKHFPGKGAAKQDAHLTLPTVALPRAEMMRRHVEPFRAAVRAGTLSLMSSHAVYPALDPSRAPSTFSRRIMHGLLRKNLGFKGVSISDDLCMGAVTESRGIPESAVESFLAGHDLLIVAHLPPAQLEAAEALRAALAEGRIPAEHWKASLSRIERLLKRASPKPRALPKPDDALALDISRRAVELCRKGATPLPLPRDSKVAVLWPDLKEVRDRFTFEGSPQAAFARLKSRILRKHPRAVFRTTPIISEKSLDPALKAARKAEVALFFCFEAMRFTGQMRTLKALRSACPAKTAAILMRNPWDLDLLKPETTAIHAYGYRDCQLQALLEVL